MNINKFINTLSLGLKNNLSGARNTVVKYNFNNRRILNNNFNINLNYNLIFNLILNINILL